jgi:hypothetical protein
MESASVTRWMREMMYVRLTKKMRWISGGNGSRRRKKLTRGAFLPVHGEMRGAESSPSSISVEESSTVVADDASRPFLSADFSRLALAWEASGVGANPKMLACTSGCCRPGLELEWVDGRPGLGLALERAKEAPSESIERVHRVSPTALVCRDKSILLYSQILSGAAQFLTHTLSLTHTRMHFFPLSLPFTLKIISLSQPPFFLSSLPCGQTCRWCFATPSGGTTYL